LDRGTQAELMSRDYLVIGIIGTVLGALLAEASAGWRRRRRGRLAAHRAAQGRKAELLESRRRDFCAAQSVSYANSDPLLVIEGRGAMLYDESGRGFLDTRNNVAHIGHCHPAVAQAVAAQVGVLNTNMRYLHPTVCELARRLLSTFPPPLRDGVVFFVNSGSEANDLALRLARAANAKRADRTIVVEHAYHGHTIAALGISPYKFEHASFGGRGQPDWVTQCPAPDTYRGLHRGPDAGARYAEYVEAACAAAGERGVCAFVIESGMSVAGVLLPPHGYLERCYAAVRSIGGVCIADEVQTGFGRLGSHWWAFEQQYVVPDIVTVGKPFGNGMPLAAVVATRAISDAFAAGPEYFNTFGGNPVCAAAGLAVLDVVERKGLRDNAVVVGAALMRALASLAQHKAGRLIGDVRGAGLFVGVEFVRDRASREPATAETSLLCSRLKDRHRILTSIDGPHNNVMVIKPPLCFTARQVRTLVYAMRRELAALASADLTSVSHTPT